MKFVKCAHRKDFGHEWYLQFLNTGKSLPKVFKNKSVLQLSFCLDDEPSSPYVQICSGYGRIFDILIAVYKFSFSMDLFGHTWNYERLDSLDKLHDETEDLASL